MKLSQIRHAMNFRLRDLSFIAVIAGLVLWISLVESSKSQLKVAKSRFFNDLYRQCDDISDDVAERFPKFNCEMSHVGNCLHLRFYSSEGDDFLVARELFFRKLFLILKPTYPATDALFFSQLSEESALILLEFASEPRSVSMYCWRTSERAECVFTLWR